MCRRVCGECGDMYHLTCLPPSSSTTSKKDKDATAAADWTCRSCLKCSSCGTAAVKEHQQVTVTPPPTPQLRLTGPAAAASSATAAAQLP